MKAWLIAMFLCCVGAIACEVAMVVITYQAKQYGPAIFHALVGCAPLIATILVVKLWREEA
jgi:hypothetical protein